MRKHAGHLHETIEAVCPILGVSISDRDDKSTWRIDFKPEATKEQQAAAVVALQAFDVSEPVLSPHEELTAKVEKALQSMMRVTR